MSRRFPGVALRLLLFAAIGTLVGKLISSGIPLKKEGGPVIEPSAALGESGIRLGREDGSETSGVEDFWEIADRPSATSRNSLSLIKSLPHMGSDEFYTLAQRSSGGSQLQDAIVREWAKRFPREMLKTLHGEHLPQDDPRREWARSAIDQWMTNNPSEAVTYLGEMPRYPGRGGYDPHLSAIGSAKRSGDYGLAIELETMWPSGAWTGTDSGKFEAWYSAQPETALQKISKIGSPGLRRDYLKQVGRISAEGSDEVILATSESFSELDRKAFLEGVVGAMAVESVEESLEFLSRNFDDPNLLNAAGSAVTQWAKEDPRAAIEWGGEHLYGETREKVMVTAIRQVARDDMKLAESLVMEIEPATVRSHAVSEMLNERLRMKGESAQDTAEWVFSIRDERTRDFMLEENWSVLGLHMPELGMILSASEDPRIASDRRIVEFAMMFRLSQQKKFESWLGSLPERNRRIAEGALK